MTIYYAKEAAKLLGVDSREFTSFLKILKHKKIGGFYRLSIEEINKIAEMIRTYNL